MKVRPSRSNWDMDAGTLVSLSGAAGWTLTLDYGRAWVTLEGYSQDKWLHPGERFSLPSGGSLVIETDRASRLGLEPPPTPSVSTPGLVRRAGARLHAALADVTLCSPERGGCTALR